MSRNIVVGALVAISLGGVALSRGWADGISETPMYYSGVLEQEGVLVEGTRNIAVGLWDDPSDPDTSHRLCATQRDDVLIEHGRFRVDLDTGCTSAIQSAPDLWVEIRVGDESLGRTKVGAVPYAVESARASDASGALRERLDTMSPPGSVIAFAGQRPPTGWLLCDGAEVARDEYPALFAAIGTAHGGGDGATTFRLPDYRGRFLRGLDATAGRDPDAGTRAAASPGGNEGNAIGSVQEFSTAAPRTPFLAASAGSHTHTYLRSFGSTGGGSGGISVETYDMEADDTGASGDHTHVVDGGDLETRPRNAAVDFIIRY